MSCETNPIKAGWRFPGDDPRTVQQVRARVAEVLRDVVPAPVLADVVLAASELAGNAIRHTASGDDGGRYAVAVMLDGFMVRVAVLDQGGRSCPRVAAPEELADPLGDGGRGLGTLAQLGTVGWLGNEHGRRVWADLPAIPAGGAR